LIEIRWHSSVLNVQSFRGADCDTDNSLVGGKVREKLLINKPEEQKFDMARYDLKNLTKWK
jgi:hypothetical protein